MEIYDVSGGPGSVVGIAGRHALDGPRFDGGKRFYIFHTRRERLRGPRNFQINIYRVFVVVVPYISINISFFDQQMHTLLT
jgi:hypothetical protein